MLRLQTISDRSYIMTRGFTFTKSLKNIRVIYQAIIT